MPVRSHLKFTGQHLDLFNQLLSDMRFLFLALSLAPIMRALGTNVQTLADTAKTQADSSRLYMLTPHESKRSDSQLGFYAVKVTDKVPFTIHSGLSIIGMLYGRIPTYFSTNPLNAGGTGGAMMIIDGVSVNSNITGLYNLNAYEYSDITASRSAAAGFAFGGDSGNGSLFLTSKSGKGITEGELELNSFTTLNISTATGVTGASENNNRWVFNNTLAYSKDFGKVDARVSYNFLSNPYSDASQGRVHNHNLRLNTGAEITCGFSARLIFDYINRADLFRYESGWPAPGTVIEDDQHDSYVQGNLFLKYEFGNGLEITSRNVLGKTDSDLTSRMTNLNDEQKKRMHNLIVSYRKRLVPGFTLSSYAGVSIDKFNSLRTLAGGSQSSWSEVNIDSEAIIAGADVGIGNYLHAEYNLRSDNHSTFQGAKDRLSHSVNGAFLWSHAFGLTSSTFSTGKLRASWVDGDFGLGSIFPLVPGNDNMITLPVVYGNKAVDIGADFGFHNDRYRISASWFRNVGDRLIPVSGMPGGVPPTPIIADLHYYGWEVQVSGTHQLSQGLQLETILSWWAANDEIASKGGNPGQAKGSRDFPGGPYPSWRSTLLNQMTYKKFFLNVVLDYRKEESVFYDGVGNVPTLIIDTKRLMLLPDFTAGIRSLQLPNTPVKRLILLLSARNPFTLYESNKHLENSSVLYQQRGRYSFGVTAAF